MPKTRSSARYRRAPSAVLYWRDDRLLGRSWQSDRPVVVAPELLPVLMRLDSWMAPDSVRTRAGLDGTPGEVVQLLERLRSVGLVERFDDPQPPAPMHHAWHPEAGLFHFATTNARFGPDPLAYDVALRRKARTHPPPAPTRRVSGRRQRMPAGELRGTLAEVLAQRRTWRRFQRRPISSEELATLLRTTFGVQKWGRVRGQGPIALKTSPSAGARHPLEAYVLVRRVDGVRPGAYHFDAATGELVRVGGPVTRSDLGRMLGNQPYFAEAAVIVFMVAAFERTLWRYPSSRAYRTILIDAGHLGQTFCLAATGLGLACFSTMALVEREVERVFKLDRLTDGPMYVVGAGVRGVLGSSHAGSIPRRLR